MRLAPSLLCFLLISSASVLAGQSAPAKTPAQQEATPIFKSSTRVVLLSVQVSDGAGAPFHGLKARDFTILEDGKRQQLRGFEENGPGISATDHSAPLNLPPDTYTNYLTTRTPGAVNILLFDSLNTGRENLAFARQQMLLYLSKLPHDAKVALF